LATKCPQCQAENADQSKFCAECGSRLGFGGEVLFSKTMTLETGYKVLGKGKVFAGKYEIVGEIGRGGMGVVYRADDIKLKRTVALKFLPPELSVYPEAKERFIREAQAAAALSHPNICTIHEVEEADGQPYIAMEYVEGQSLHQKISKGPIDCDTAVDIAVQVASGLEAAHQRGIIHRDIKSANIMVTEKAQAKIMDFGLAKVAGESQLTKEARTIGTIAYMSPEQAQGEDLDKRTDIWSFGVVLYEMLTGQLPFRGDRESIILHSIVGAEPKPLRQISADIPVELQKIIDRALKKKREDRYASAAEMAADLAKYLESRRAEEAGFFNLKSLARRMKRPAYFIPTAATVLALAFSVVWFFNRQAKIRWATNEILPQINKLIEQEEYFGAFKMAEQAERYIGKNLIFQEALGKTSAVLSIVTTPPGASVDIKEYETPKSDWVSLGLTPVKEGRIPLGFLRWKIEKQGYATQELAEKTDAFMSLPNKELNIELREATAVPEGMVWIPGEDAFWSGLVGQFERFKVNGFWMDKYEVTNKKFKEFVVAGGYAKPEYWKQPFLKNGKPLGWEQAMKEFRDRTEQPGPATWELSTYPKGQDEYPVSGVSWYEAAAYAEFKGKSLPTVHHWDLALDLVGKIGSYVVLSNFSGKGPAPVGSFQGMSGYGVYDLVGNVKEWCWNESRGSRYIMGGAWDEATYMAILPILKSPFDRLPDQGFRCVQEVSPEDKFSKAREPATLLERDYSKEKPVPEQVFEVYKGLYAYDKTDLKAKIEERDESSEYWTSEKISYDTAYDNQRMAGYLYLPKKGIPPFGTVIYYPSGGAWITPTSKNSGLELLDFLLIGGRAVFVPVFLSAWERRDGFVLTSFRNKNSLRDHYFKWSKDLGRSIDYLETRSEIDKDKLAYYGMSAGGVVGPVLLAVEPRIKVGILEAGGFLSGTWGGREQAPEADPFNFAPRIKIPMLMLNGRYDFVKRVQEGQSLLYECLGTPPENKFWKIYESDHHAPRLERIKEMTTFLDKYLGPVK
jgi:serine/threonine protein kinase/formylglycine-generating enzyme required for sulfatase activity/cephalosporin-C deacetylase-like acetyl esterase